MKYEIIWLLVSFRGFFGRLYFCTVKNLNFHNSFLAVSMKKKKKKKKKKPTTTTLFAKMGT